MYGVRDFFFYSVFAYLNHFISAIFLVLYFLSVVFENHKKQSYIFRTTFGIRYCTFFGLNIQECIIYNYIYK